MTLEQAQSNFNDIETKNHGYLTILEDFVEEKTIDIISLIVGGTYKFLSTKVAVHNEIGSYEIKLYLINTNENAELSINYKEGDVMLYEKKFELKPLEQIIPMQIYYDGNWNPGWPGANWSAYFGHNNVSKEQYYSILARPTK